VVVVAHVAFLAPELSAREGLPAIAAGALHFRVFSANVYAYNTTPRPISEEIRAAAPDVVFLQEAGPAFVKAVDDSGAVAALPYRVTVPRDDPFAGLLASRWPLVDTEVVELAGRPIIVRATAMTEQGPVRLYSIHTISPVSGARPKWIDELHHIAAALRAESGPVLVAGDFNATWGNKGFREVLDAGLTDAAAARGRPLQMTWPRDRHWIPPLIRIDHILTTAGLTVTAIRTGHGQGSDHRPIVADVAVMTPIQ
jgi:endonuclease/exonuclease/phosphatase (EEP) superfamily protein YafD